MRVLLVIDGMHPRDGGPPAVVAGSAEALRACGIEVAVLTAVRPGDEAEVRATWRSMLDSGVELHFCEAPGASALFFGTALGDDVRALVEGADVIHLHALWAPLPVLVARYAKRVGTPYLVSTHGVLDHRAMHRTWPKWAKKRLFVALAGLRPMLRDAFAVVYGSEAEAEESWNMAPGMTRLYVPNGVAATVARVPVPSEERARIARIAPQLASWKRTLLFFSRIHPEKGPDMLVKAFNAVAADYPDAGLLIAGLRQLEDYQREVEALIEQGGHSNQIVLTTELTGAKGKFLHSLCDIFVLPSHAEGFSVALVEALAHRMPCLITTYCHQPFVEREGAGVVVEPNPASIEAGLRKLLSMSDEELAAMGADARKLFEARYTWEKVAEQLEAIYRSAAAGAPARAH